MTNKERAFYILGNIGVLESTSKHCTQESHDLVTRQLNEVEKRGMERAAKVIEDWDFKSKHPKTGKHLGTYRIGEILSKEIREAIDREGK